MIFIPNIDMPVAEVINTSFKIAIIFLASSAIYVLGGYITRKLTNDHEFALFWPFFWLILPFALFVIFVSWIGRKAAQGKEYRYGQGQESDFG